MKVAWHEVPGILMKAARPGGNGLKRGKVFVHTPRFKAGVTNRSYRTLRDGIMIALVPGTSCQATFIQSLRDIGCYVVASATRSQIPSYRIVSPISSTSISAVKPLPRLR
jgi:hypothetical protein